jgi:membrane protein implicated in regulation of membrane protease activity
MGRISEDMSTLMRQEMQLAKAELTVEAKKAGAAAAMLAAAGVAGFFLLMFALITLWQALASLFDESAWAALIVTVLLAVIAGVLALMGKKKLQQVNPKPEQTIETLQEAPSALKPTNR